MPAPVGVPATNGLEPAVEAAPKRVRKPRAAAEPATAIAKPDAKADGGEAVAEVKPKPTRKKADAEPGTPATV